MMLICEPLGTGVPPAETTVELTHLTTLGGHIALQFGTQQVHRPNANPRIADSLAGQVRLEVTL